MFRVLVVLFSFSILQNGFSQIVDEEGEKIKEKKIKKEKKVKCDTCDYSLFYLNGTVQRSFREFEDNSVYSSYSDWELQTPDINFGLNGGLLIDVSSFLQLEIGASYFGHGENFNFDDPNSDSTFSFTNKYMQLSVPLKLKYVYGNDFKFYAGLGVMPSNILNIRYDESYRRAAGTELIVKEQAKIKNDFSSFNIYALGTLGIQYYFNFIGFNLGVDYRYGLSNTYASTTKMIDHKMNALVLNYGIILKL